MSEYKCEICGSYKNIEESHDVPCYLFYKQIGRRKRKEFADKLGRHLLCKECHEKYENELGTQLKMFAKRFSIKYFKRMKWIK